MAITLEQLRAADAWQRSKDCDSEYINLAKGLPMLIMQSGLLQTLAFLHEKSKKSHAEKLGMHLRAWLTSRFPEQIKTDDFQTVMTALMKAEPQVYRHITTEAYAWLRWVRQIAPARNLGVK